MMHNILFIKKPDNPINEKKYNMPYEKYHMYYYKIKLEIYSIKFILYFSKSRIVILCSNYILVFNL